MTTAPADDLLGTAMVDFAAGRRSPVWLRVASGDRLAHELAAYFAPVTAQEHALLHHVQGPVLDVGCGPARHAPLLQARGLTAIGLDRSLLALDLARSLGLRHWVHADVRSGPLPPARTALLLDGNLGLAGTPTGGAQLLRRLATACGPGGRLLVSGRAARHGTFNSGKNGQVTALLTVSPPPSDISCPPGQSLELALVIYTNVVLTDTTNNVSIAVGTFDSGCLLPNVRGAC